MRYMLAGSTIHCKHIRRLIMQSIPRLIGTMPTAAHSPSQLFWAKPFSKYRFETLCKQIPPRAAAETLDQPVDVINATIISRR
ncbi:hypothetical protein CBM2634_U190005 [Cupriavidus taiwanensis]|uniref:Uncharacterized protein n=1 Tax=Cupriavidus taiwanensis TaxID=164546 RepID=A0A375JCS3_9BURK|nr:hypothetical protein CBM2634_U190005 [Cupriavidus taiwanensis]